MRQLKMADIYKMSRILKKMDIKLDTKEKTQDEVGSELIMKIVSNLDRAETEINEFVGSLIGMTGEEFAELPLMESQKYLEEFKNQPSLASFFERVGKLMK